MIPPAWKDVWISASASSKLQATGVDGAGRKQYLYHPSFRAQREQEKFDKLIRFAEGLPDLREAMAEHMDNDLLDRDRVSAIATRLINRGWFRVGTERYAKESKTFGITTLRKNHVTVRGHRIAFHFRGKHRSEIRTTLVDSELAESVKELLALPRGARLFRYEWDGGLCALTGAKLNEYVRTNLGEDFTAKDFRTWGGTLLAAIALAEHGPAESETAGEAGRHRGHAPGGGAARKHARRCARVVRQPGGHRPVSRRHNDRGFPAAAFARGRCARFRSRPRGTGPFEPAPFVAN